MKRVALGLTLALLAGCTTLEDFEAMSPTDRAIDTCLTSNTIRTMDNDLRGLDEAIRIAQGNVARGYALHRQCVDEQVPYTTHGDCVTDRHGHTRCREVTHTRTVTTCKDVPVAIDVRFEQEKADKYLAQRVTLSKERERLFGACVKAVKVMPAAQAYTLWENNLFPAIDE